MKLTCIFLLLVYSSMSFSADIAYPGFLKKMNRNGISTTVMDDQSVLNLESYLTKKINEINEKLESASKKEARDLKEFKAYYQFSQDFLKLLIEQVGPYKSYRYYMTALRVIYSIESELQPHIPFKLTDIAKLMTRLVTKIPYTSMANRVRSIGKNQASKEAAILIDPKTNEYISPDELALMNTVEVSKLDIPADHPVWYQESVMASMPNKWNELEAWAQKYQANY